MFSNYDVYFSDCIAFTGEKWALLEQDTIGFLAGSKIIVI
jgi:hypothetical protein